MKKYVVGWLAGSCLVVVVNGGVLAQEGNAAPPTANAGRVPDTAQVRQKMSTLAVPFEANTGQQDERVAFTARTSEGTLFVTRAGVLVYGFAGLPVAGQDAREAIHKRGPGWVLTETLVDARPVVHGNAPSATRVSRFIGNDPSRWQASVPTFDRVAFGEAWPGIQVELTARRNGVEKFFTVAPGADARRIAIQLAGAKRLELAADGALVAHTGNGPVSFTAPCAWQDIKGERKSVRVAYALAGDRYGFHLRGYDPAYPVVIDPLLQSTYLGGSGYDGIHGMALDASGNVFVTGYTQSNQDFPVTASGPQQSYGGGAFDAFVAKLDNTLTLPPLQVTYLGGNAFDEGTAIAVNKTSGDVYVGGVTRSMDFPFAGSGVQTSNGGGTDGFLAKLDNALTTINATYLGGSGNDAVTAIVVANATNGDVFVTGYTSGNFPVTGGVSPPYGGGISDALVAKLDYNLATPTATYLGGNADDSGNAIALDPSGHVLVAGQTQSVMFPGTGSGAQSSPGGSDDAFVARLDPAFTGPIQATYFGGSGADEATGIAVDPTNGDVFVVGNTSGNLPHTAGGAQPALSGWVDAFAAKLNNTLTTPAKATYLGGNADDYGNAITLDVNGHVFVAGVTRSPDFPQTAGGVQPALAGANYNNFVARLNNGLSPPITQATYLGATLEDESPSLALDGNGYVFVAAHTSSLSFPGTTGGTQSFFAGGSYDGYVSKLTHGLHGAPYTATDDGDPHITTTNGIHYNFQSAGEFTALRDLAGLEIQTRQSPTSTFGPYFDGYTALTTCVSLNTALAARVGKHRVTYQPNFKNAADPAGLQLRVDGVLTPLTTAGLNLSGGGRIVQTAGALEIDFPDGTVLIATPYWAAPQWLLNIAVYRTDATEGIMGSVPQGSWLPALPNGTSVGPMPPLHQLPQRYVTLNQTFANAWRVRNKTSLFDYAPGTSTATFTFVEWPAEKGPCVVPNHPPPAKPIEPARAREICRQITDKTRNADCVFDVAVTGVPGFAEAYLLTQRIEAGATAITVRDTPGPGNAQTKKPAPIFTATVPRLVAGGKTPSGTVQFMLDGRKTGNPVRLDAHGLARWKGTGHKPGEHRLSARYLPDKGSVFLPSSSEDKVVVIGGAR
jgi:hypothetical protein